MLAVERFLRVVVVAIVVVVSMTVVDISGGMEVVCVVPKIDGTSPTSRTLPLILRWLTAGLVGWVEETLLFPYVISLCLAWSQWTRHQNRLP